MVRELIDSKHNAYHRGASKKYYNTPNGRLTAKLKYLRNKHKDVPEILNILNDATLEKQMRIEKIKVMELRVKMDKLKQMIENETLG